MDCLTMIAVLLQAMKEDPPLDAKCRDKFLVQSVAVTADREFSNVQSIVRRYTFPHSPKIGLADT
jgi:hypothetical protein